MMNFVMSNNGQKTKSKIIMKRNHLLASLLIGATTVASSFAQLTYNCEGCLPLADRPVVNLSTLDANADGNFDHLHTILTCDKMWILDQKMSVPANGTLTILPGVVVKALYLGEFNSAALIVPRDAKIYANGSECCPIIFTSIDDNLDGTYPIETKERWGGIILLGRAHNTVGQGEFNPENGAFVIGGSGSAGIGFIEGVPATDPRNVYGAALASGETFNNDDNSGSLSYFSIRHGGSELGTANEINGLTLGSVGRATSIRNIEIVSNGDDGIEFFGGTVDLKYVRIMYVEDDYLDWDQGYTGRIQHALLVKRSPIALPDSTKQGDHGMECDGDDGTLFVRNWLSHPILSNITILGNGNSGDMGFELKERTQGEIYNAVVSNFVTGIRYAAGVDVTIKNSTFVNVPTLTSGTPVQALDGTVISVPTLAGFTSTNWANNWDAVPAAIGIGAAFDVKNAVEDPAEITAGYYPADYYNWFDAVTYRGAFDPAKEAWWGMTNCPNAQGANEFRESVSSKNIPEDNNFDGVVNAADLSNVNGRYNKTNDQP